MATDFEKQRRRLHPSFFHAIAQDARRTREYRNEVPTSSGKIRLTFDILRLSFVSDAFIAQVLYRARMRMIRFRVPVLPWLFHRLSMSWCQVCIGIPVVIAPGLYLPHGQVVIDGITEFGRDCVVFPWVTVGLKAGNFRGPTIGDGVTIGTGARVLGEISIGEHASIGANAVVISDIPSHSTAVGVPARITAPR
jgi:serine O-acetyltransferase